MSALARAILQPLSAGRESTPEGDPVTVQFNPASLQLHMTNEVEGGRTQTRPAEQYTGTSSATLSLELHFDTADEGDTDAPVSVRTRSAAIGQFVLPQTGQSKQSPRRVRFQWGDLIFDGVMTSVTEDLDLFAASGVPLRSKVTISISGQDPNYESLASGAGAATGAGASAPGGAGIAVGAKIGVALAGESPADLAARNGLDPAAWRSVSAPGGLSVSLAAGTEVALPAATPGVVARASGAGAPSAAERIAAVAGPAPSPGPAAATATGLALAGAGGLAAAVQSVQQARAAAASGAQRAAFGAPRGGPAAAADPRAVSFGPGVPLRPLLRAPTAGRPVLARRAPAAAAAPPFPASDCGCGCGGRP